MIKAGIILGAAFGGFADGIVLHQILGWHHLICTTAHCQPESVDHLRRQNTQDGFFHLALWFIALVGIGMLYQSLRTGKGAAQSVRVLIGAMLVGWGLFNFLEGAIDHQILGIHHVLPGTPNQFLWDMLFLASGILLAFVGHFLIKAKPVAL